MKKLVALKTFHREGITVIKGTRYIIEDFTANRHLKAGLAKLQSEEPATGKGRERKTKIAAASKDK